MHVQLCITFPCLVILKGLEWVPLQLLVLGSLHSFRQVGIGHCLRLVWVFLEVFRNWVYLDLDVLVLVWMFDTEMGVCPCVILVFL